jgi:glycosyltransferase involved in cell wall biosynthesis
MFIASSLIRGGAEGLVVDLVNNLDRQYFKPSLCVLHSGVLLSEVKSDVPVFSDLIKWGGDVRVLPKLKRIIRTQSPSIIDVTGRDDAALWGRIAAKLSGTAIVINSEHHGSFSTIQDPKRMLYHKLNRLLDFWTNAFVMVSQAQRDFFVQKGLPAKKTVVIYNGIELEKFACTDSVRNVARKSMGLSEETPVIGMVANFRYIKRHDVLLQAMVKMREIVSAVHCLLIGDGPLRVQIEKLAEQIGLDGAVSFLGSRSDVPELLSSLDVFVLTSDSESFSNVIIEAMAASLPVVATKCGGPEEIVVEGETGFLVAPAQPLILAEMILVLLQNPSIALQMGQAGRIRAAQHFSLERMVAARADLFSQLLNEKGILHK